MKTHGDKGIMTLLAGVLGRVGHFVFHMLFLRGVLVGLLRLKAYHRERLPQDGPAIVIANHNSHADAMVLMCLYPYGRLRRVVPIAAADYWFTGAVMRWFVVRVVGAVPIFRQREGDVDSLASAHQVLEAGRIAIIFPEGSRGQPEQMTDFKSGVFLLAQRFPQVPIVPVYLHGVARLLPRGRYFPRPHRLYAVVGEPVFYQGQPKAEFLAHLRGQVETLAREFWHHRHVKQGTSLPQPPAGSL